MRRIQREEANSPLPAGTKKIGYPHGAAASLHCPGMRHVACHTRRSSARLSPLSRCCCCCCAHQRVGRGGDRGHQQLPRENKQLAAIDELQRLCSVLYKHSVGEGKARTASPPNQLRHRGSHATRPEQVDVAPVTCEHLCCGAIRLGGVDSSRLFALPVCAPALWRRPGRLDPRPVTAQRCAILRAGPLCGLFPRSPYQAARGIRITPNGPRI